MTKQSRKHFFKSVSIGVLLIGMAVFGMTGQAQALLVPQLQFDLPNTGVNPAWSVTYAGQSSPTALLTGTVKANNVMGVNTPLNGGLPGIPITDGVFTFESGNLKSYDSINKTWHFDQGGRVMLTGSIAALGISKAPLMWGTFTTDVTVARTDIGGIYNFNVTSGGFQDEKNPVLTAYYGLPNTGYAGVFDLIFSAKIVGNNGLSSTSITGGTVVNAAPVPVPPSVLLLGTSLAGFIAFRRKISKK